jgi:uncharacterized protein involved in exopolysaccharide biosynthesis/Mrp family chromosome partitioning ATPase
MIHDLVERTAGDGEAGPAESSSGQNPIREGYRVLLKQKWMVAVPLVVALIFVVFFTRRQRPLYEAAGKLQLYVGVQPATSSPVSQEALWNQRQKTVQTQVEVLQSPELMRGALRRVPFRVWGLPTLIVEQVMQSDIVSVTVRWPDRDQAAQIANAVMEEFIAEGEGMSRRAVRASLQYVRRELGVVGPQLEGAAQDIKEFQRRTRLVALPEQTTQLVGQLATFESTLTNTRTLLRANEVKLAQTREQIRHLGRTVVSSRAFGQNPIVGTLQGQLYALQVQRATLLAEYAPTSRKVAELDAQIAAVSARLKGEARTIVSGSTEGPNPAFTRLEDQIATLESQNVADREQIRALEQSCAGTRQRLDRLPEEQYRFAQLKRRYTTLEASYNDLLAKQQALEVSESATVADARVHTHAGVPVHPVSPNWHANLALAAALGLALGLGLAFLREFWMDTVDTAAQVRHALHLPVIGAVPSHKAALGSRLSAPGLTMAWALLARRRGTALTESREPGAESWSAATMEGYQFIASLLLASLVPAGVRRRLPPAGGASPGRVLLLTSAGSGQGNTTTGVGLAAALAHRNQSVVLVDLDLRKPSLHRFLETPDAPGIADVIAGTATIEQALHASPLDGVRVMPVGRHFVPPAPGSRLAALDKEGLPQPGAGSREPGAASAASITRLLSSPGLPDVLQEVARAADIVILDTPPCVTVTDASIIAPSADMTVLVLGAGKSEKRAALRAREILRAVGAPPVGVILNRADVAANGYYYRRGDCGAGEE